jgi:hypothetical protein
LRAENAPLRVPGETGLASVPLSHFDGLLLSCTVAHWRKVARVIGEALVETWETGFDQVSDVVLAARVQTLAAEGRVESQGYLLRPRHSEIRLPQQDETAGAGETQAVRQLSSSVSQ